MFRAVGSMAAQAETDDIKRGHCPTVSEYTRLRRQLSLLRCELARAIAAQQQGASAATEARADSDRLENVRVCAPFRHKFS